MSAWSSIRFFANASELSGVFNRFESLAHPVYVPFQRVSEGSAPLIVSSVSQVPLSSEIHARTNDIENRYAVVSSADLVEGRATRGGDKVFDASTCVDSVDLRLGGAHASGAMLGSEVAWIRGTQWGEFCRSYFSSVVRGWRKLESVRLSVGAICCYNRGVRLTWDVASPSSFDVKF